jgi:hypothetical protein
MEIGTSTHDIDKLLTEVDNKINDWVNILSKYIKDENLKVFHENEDKIIMKIYKELNGFESDWVFCEFNHTKDLILKELKLK